MHDQEFQIATPFKSQNAIEIESGITLLARSNLPPILRYARSAFIRTENRGWISRVNEVLAQPYLRGPVVAQRFEPGIVHEYAIAVSSVSRPSRLTQQVVSEAIEHLGGLRVQLSESN